MEYVRLKGLKAEEYQHPKEKMAFDALRKIPYLDEFVAIFLKYIVQLQALPAVQGDCFRITAENCPHIYELYRIALNRLDMPEEYPLYAKSEYSYNAMAYGGKAPFILVHSSVLNDLSDEEFLALIGHEIGHIKSGHSIYSMMAHMIGSLITSVRIPMGNAVSLGLDLALTNWARAHELTADRAGAIACGDINASIQMLGRFMGANERTPFVTVTTEDLLAQKAEFDEKNKDIVTKLFCLIQIAEQNHPYSITRIQELKRWADSGEFQKLLDSHGG